MATDRQTVGHALRRLVPGNRGTVKKEAIEAAAAALPAEQAQHIRRAVNQLSDQFHGLGPGSALEILAAIGMLWNEDGHER